MATLPLNKKDVPFLLGGKGELSVDAGKLRPFSPVPEDSTTIFNVGFSAAGAERIALGSGETVKIGLSTTANATLTPLFSTSANAVKLLEPVGLGDFFTAANRDKMVLVFDVGAAADASVAGSFTYSALKASVELDAGADAGYTYVRALDKKLKVEQLLPAFFKQMRLPEQGSGAPEPGEAIALRYGGYVTFTAEVSAGYQLAGTKSVSIGQLALSEKYDLSILGKVGLSAGVAGRYAILVTSADLPGWTRVRVHRQRSKDLKIAADVTVNFANALTDLPADAHEFLGAVLGTNAKNFLNVFQKALELSDFEKFKAAIDGLARKYIEEFTGNGFDALASKTGLQTFLARVNRVVTSYDTLGDRAITLFDRHFDRLDQLAPFMERLRGLTSAGLAALRKELTPRLWAMLSQLTDGDPLGFLLGQVTIGGRKVDALEVLRARAGAVLDLIGDDAHQELRDAIGLAKQGFGIDRLFRELAKVDTVDELKSVASDKLGFFVTRLLGRTLDSSTNLKLALDEIHTVLTRIDGFTNRLYDTFKAAVNSSYKTALHAEYSRASEADALIDVLINMNESSGARLLAQAGRGDFVEIIATSDTDRVRLQEGVFTHRTRRASAFKVNIVGWHLNYNYQGFDRVITDTEQRLIPSDQGITVLTTATLEVERERKRRGEAMHVDFLLRALGESKKVIKSDDRTLGYLIDTLSSLTARYQLNFTDDDTSPPELSDYLAFAGELGLDKKGASLADLRPLLPTMANGSFGKLVAAYDVRFGDGALTALLSITSLSAAGEVAIRSAMRDIVLSNYLKGDTMHDVAFAYATPAVFDVFEAEGFAKFQSASQREFGVRLSNAGILAPSRVTLDRTERIVLSTLYHIENSMIEAIRNLYKLLQKPKGSLSPAKFEDALGDFGSALKDFDRFDQTTSAGGVGTSTIFMMFDRLVRLASGDSASNSVLRLESVVNETTTEKLFMTDAAAAGR
jgi:hypothetical protein